MQYKVESIKVLEILQRINRFNIDLITYMLYEKSCLKASAFVHQEGLRKCKLKTTRENVLLRFRRGCCEFDTEHHMTEHCMTVVCSSVF